MANEKSDEDLMLEYKLGDESSFLLLYERHAGKVYGYLSSKTKNEALARDIFQASFLKLHAKRDLYKKGLPFLPWIFTICRNELVDTLRKKKRSLEDPSERIAEFPAPEPVVKNVVNLQSIPEVQARAVELRYDEELPFEAIAERLETTPVNARQLVSRGIKALRRIYGKQ
jgi:RNA polymerase sigma-70 factor (ECF subfamily)